MNIKTYVTYIRVSVVVLFVVVLVVEWAHLIRTFWAEEENVPETNTTEVVGVTADELRIGVSAAFSGLAKELGTQYVTYGADIAVREFNDRGGVCGHKIILITRDDGYEPDRAIENTEALIQEDEVFVLANYVGTPTGVAVAPLLEENHVPLIGLFSGAEAFRNPVQKYIFNIRPSYYQEMEKVVSYFVDTLGLSKIAVFYQDDAFGIAGLDGLQKALARRDMKVYDTATYMRNIPEVGEAVEKIGNSDAEAVVMIGTYSQLADFTHQVKEMKPETYFHTLSFVGPEFFADRLEGDTEHVYVTQVVPPPYYTDVFDGLSRYIDTLHHYYPEVEPTFGGLEGYISMRVLLEAISDVRDTLTREDLVKALEHLQYHDIGLGADIEFNTDSHQALNTVYLTTIVDGEYVIVPVKNSDASNE